jgi:hypothetical protein
MLLVVQTACTSLNILFSSMGLTTSEALLFTRKHERPPILVRIRSYVLPQTTCFKYLGKFFDSGFPWSCHVKYLRRRCLQRVNLLKSVTGVSWGAHQSCLILLYSAVCFTHMAKTCMLGLEWVQFRALRIARV